MGIVIRKAVRLFLCKKHYQVGGRVGYLLHGKRDWINGWMFWTGQWDAVTWQTGGDAGAAAAMPAVRITGR